ncbi:hypothetical protein [Nocardia noduli]|uniref:hypothetical protein n=1 Tax=Nocardia noduli TaxID=2815722 RepID=UPI001C2410A6|nr:hypothetical protein [Nocardia noduli]
MSGLAKTARLVKAAGAQVHTEMVDVADRVAVARWTSEVIVRFGTVHQVVPP